MSKETNWEQFCKVLQKTSLTMQERVVKATEVINNLAKENKELKKEIQRLKEAELNIRLKQR